MRDMKIKLLGIYIKKKEALDYVTKNLPPKKKKYKRKKKKKKSGERNEKRLELVESGLKSLVSVSNEKKRELYIG